MEDAVALLKLNVPDKATTFAPRQYVQEQPTCASGQEAKLLVLAVANPQSRTAQHGQINKSAQQTDAQPTKRFANGQSIPQAMEDAVAHQTPPTVPHKTSTPVQRPPVQEQPTCAFGLEPKPPVLAVAKALETANPSPLVTSAPPTPASAPKLVAYGTILQLEDTAIANNQSSTVLNTTRQTAHSECVQTFPQLNTADGQNHQLEHNKVLAVAHNHHQPTASHTLWTPAELESAQEPTNTVNGTKLQELLTATAHQPLEQSPLPVT